MGRETRCHDPMKASRRYREVCTASAAIKDWFGRCYNEVRCFGSMVSSRGKRRIEDKVTKCLVSRGLDQIAGLKAARVRQTNNLSKGFTQANTYYMLVTVIMRITFGLTDGK